MHFGLVRRDTSCLKSFVCRGLAQHQLFHQSIEALSTCRDLRRMPVAKAVAADATTTAREKELGCRPSPGAVRARSASLRLLLRRRFLPITWQHLLYSPLAPGREGSATGSMSAAGTNESLLGMMTSARLPSFSTALRSTIPFRNSTYATTEYT